MNKYFSLDIDGPISNYPECWCNFINMQQDINFQSKEEAKKYLGKEKYFEIKELYRTSGYKGNLPLNDGIHDLIDFIYSNDYKILLMTSRPFLNYPGLFELTQRWLKKNNINYEVLLEKNSENIDKYYKIHYHVDDEIEQCQPFINQKIRCFLLNKDNSKESINGITKIDHLSDIYKILNKNL